MNIVKGGRSVYGQAIGILVLETTYPYIPIAVAGMADKEEFTQTIVFEKKPEMEKHGLAFVFEPTEPGTFLIRFSCFGA